MRKFCSFLFLGLLISFNSFAITPTPEQIKKLRSVGKSKILNIQLWNDFGLGNRLKKIVSYTRYYKPKHLNLFWVNKGWVTARFSDLFVLDWPVTITEFNDDTLIKLSGDLVSLHDWIENWGLLVTEEDFKTTEPFMIDCQYNRIPEEIKKIYLPYFTKIKPSPFVQKRLDELKLPKEFIPVQVRNNKDWKDFFDRETPYIEFFDVMDKYPADTIFYLSAMSKDVAKVFYERYPNRIIELPNKDYTSMIDAVADMFVLGTQKEAIYSFGSTFPEVAWWIGGAKAKVTIIGKDDGKNYKLPILDKIY